MTEVRQLVLNSRWKHAFAKAICKQTKTTHFHHIESNSAQKGQIHLIGKVLCQIRSMTDMRQVLLNSRSEHGFAKSVWIEAKTTYLSQIESNSARKDQIQLIPKVLRQIRPMTEMCELLLNSSWKHGFAKAICKQTKTTYFHQMESKSAREEQIQLISKVLWQTRSMTEMRQVLLNSRAEYAFAKSICNEAKTTCFHQIESNSARKDQIQLTLKVPCLTRSMTDMHQVLLNSRSEHSFEKSFWIEAPTTYFHQIESNSARNPHIFRPSVTQSVIRQSVSHSVRLSVSQSVSHQSVGQSLS